MTRYKTGKRLKESRERKGLTQEKLAELLNLSPNYLSSVERGVKFPRYENLVALFKQLEVTPNEIFVDEIDAVFDIREPLLSDEIRKLPPDEQRRIFSVVETMIREAQNK